MPNESDPEYRVCLSNGAGKSSDEAASAKRSKIFPLVYDFLTPH